MSSSVPSLGMTSAEGGVRLHLAVDHTSRLGNTRPRFYDRTFFFGQPNQNTGEQIVIIRLHSLFGLIQVPTTSSNQSQEGKFV